ncbi:deoxyribose-phosphate aldolase [uncultured Polaribacter sp.]|uniref:deoxyribose-phosphate aldolase n=1 Tax=uncultured Polaribacter sp. TaxID=174711 RepID=UPI00263A1C4C|nr:deoxyribose-phosphate aldolase [uncultured Polaribacter sp.]
MKINQFLDATYLKTAEQAGITEEENLQNVISLVEEAILYEYKLIMIRANYIKVVKRLLNDAKSNVLVGTVIDFPAGNSSVENKILEAKEAINLNADELDFVVNYNAFKNDEFSLIENEIEECTSLCLKHNKKAKFIIEVAALSSEEIIVISQLIKKVVIKNFGLENAKNVYVKSSTGFFKTDDNSANGATLETIKLISDNAKPLKVKAAGGVRNYDMAIKMIDLGVDRIGTSSSKQILNKEQNSNQGY